MNLYTLSIFGYTFCLKLLIYTDDVTIFKQISVKYIKIQTQKISNNWINSIIKLSPITIATCGDDRSITIYEIGKIYQDVPHGF